MNHQLKIYPEHFEPVVAGLKTAELRINDRDFKEGDIILLREFVWGSTYTGRWVEVRIAHVADVREWCKDAVLLSIEVLTK